MTILARVTEDLASARGPDVLARIELPEQWLVQGATFELSLPRLVLCARCEGGGCDACNRKGAFERDALAVNGALVVNLPRAGQAAPSEPPPPLRLRLPGYGAPDPNDATLPAGHLLLTVVPRSGEGGWVPSSAIRKLEPGRLARVDFRKFGIWAAFVMLVTLLSWWFFC